MDIHRQAALLEFDFKSIPKQTHFIAKRR